MAQTSSGDYYYIAGTVNEQLDSFAFYEDSNSDLVFYDEANDEEPKYVAGSGFDVPASRGYQVAGTQVIAGQESGNISSLTDNSGGTADDTVEAVSGSGADAAINNNFAELADEVNGIITTLKNHGLHA